MSSSFPKLLFFVGKLLVHRYGIYCIAFTTSHQKINQIYWRRPVTDRIEQKTLNGVQHGNGFLYISECETLITPSDCRRRSNLNAVGQHTMMMSVQPTLTSHTHSHTHAKRPAVFLSLSHCGRAVIGVMAPNYRLTCLYSTWQGRDPEPQNKLYFSNVCAHGRAYSRLARTCFVRIVHVFFFLSSNQTKQNYFPVEELMFRIMQK